MKRMITLWMMSLLMVLTFPAMAAMSTSKMRQHSRFLTDRMAYELNLSSTQYDDVYEVNYDFLSRTRYLIDDVVAGYTSAMDEYYDYLDVRNDDLRWILTSSQYRRFLEKEYFYRPIYTTTSGSWGFRIYRVYTDVNHFFFGKPSHYSSYKGAHYRTNFNNTSYYKQQHSTRYKNNDVYQGNNSSRPNPNKGNQNNGNFSNKENQNGNMSRPGNSTNNSNNNGSMSRPGNSTNNSNNGSMSRPGNSTNNDKRTDVNSNRSSRSSSKQNGASTSRSNQKSGRSVKR
jgi:hypothetical protein